MRRIAVFLFLLLICIGGYWDIATFQDSLKWDMLDCYFPWKFFVGESFKHQLFPLWNPYQHLGYPIYADMRSVFYPDAPLVAGLGGYNFKVLHTLFILHITLGGVGMYALSGRFTRNFWARLTAASSYILCGFFVGHGQEMFGIIAATWIPWIINYFIRFQQTLAWSDLWKLSLFLFLQLTGGYQALSLMLAYLLLVFFFVFSISGYKQGGIAALKKRVIRHAVLAMVVFSSVAVLLVTYFQVAPNAERLSGVTLQWAYLNSINWRALTSFIAPFGVTTSGADLNIDVSMANLYVGLLWLPLYALGVVQKSSAFVRAMAIFGVVCLLASMGPLTPMREWLYHYVPTMNMFRMSSFFSYFMQLSLILIGAKALGRILDAPQRHIDLFKWSVGALALLVAGIGFYHYTVWPTAGLEALTNLLKVGSVLYQFDFSQRIVFQAAIQLTLLGLFLVGLVFVGRKKALAPFVLLFVIVEMTLATHLNFPVTVGGGFKPQALQQKLDVQPHGFPIPSLHKPIGFNTEIKPALNPLWHNTNIYTKTVSYDGFNSFTIDRLNAYRLDNTAAFEKYLQQPLLFLYPQENTTGITITDYAPDGLVCQVTLTEASTLVLQQVYYPGWSISINGSTVPMQLFEDVFPSIGLTAGTHTVTFTYQNLPVLRAFGFSYAVVLLIICCIVFGVVKTQTGNNKWPTVSAVFVAFLALGVLCYGYTTTSTVIAARLAGYQQVLKEFNQHIPNRKNTTLYLQVDDPQRMQQLLEQQGWHQKTRAVGGLWGHKYMQLREWIEADSTARIVVLRSNEPKDTMMHELIRQHYAAPTTIEMGRNAVYVFEKREPRKVLFTSVNEFEDAHPDWHFSANRIDTTARAFSGQFGWTIGQAELGTPAFHQPIEKLTANTHVQFEFSLKVLIPDDEPRSAIAYVQLFRDGHQFWERSQRLDIYARKPNDWFDVMVPAIPSFAVQPGDELRAFVWSGEAAPLYVDDTRIRVYARD